MITFALLLAFVSFCGLIARTAFTQGKKALDNYTGSIRAQFDEAEHLLEEAKLLFNKAEQERLLINTQAEKIMNLARNEVQFMMEKAQKEIIHQQESYTHLFNHQVETSYTQWQESVLDTIWQHIYTYAQKITSTSSSQDVIRFVEHRLSSALSLSQQHH